MKATALDTRGLLSQGRVKEEQLSETCKVTNRTSPPARGPASWIKIILAILFSLAVLSFFAPSVFKYAHEADLAANGKISTRGDAHGYQKMAVNLLNGYGPSQYELLPLSEYKLDLDTPWGEAAIAYERKHGPRPPTTIRYDRPPGFPAMLAGAYYVFGVESMVARYLLASCAIFSAVLIVISGFLMGGFLGGTVGLAAGSLYLSSLTASSFEGILTEIPTAFWLLGFFASYLLYERSLFTRSYLLTLSGICLTAAIFSRLNFLTAVPVLVVYLLAKGVPRRHIFYFLLATGLPILLWSSYASINSGKIIFLSEQGSGLFCTSNNIDALNGFGPDQWNKGGWNPGWIVAEDGSLSSTNEYLADGADGWIRGLTFWWNHLWRLPELFYAKMKKGLWYNDGIVTGFLAQEGFFILAVGFILLGIAEFRPHGGWQKPNLAGNRELSLWPLTTQLLCLSGLMILWNSGPFWGVLLLWSAIGLLSLYRLTRKEQRLAFGLPIWFLAFIISHLFTTVMFYGSWRFHQPLDIIMLFIALYGLTLVPFRLSCRHLGLGLTTASVWLLLLAQRFEVIPGKLF